MTRSGSGTDEPVGAVEGAALGDVAGECDAAGADGATTTTDRTAGFACCPEAAGALAEGRGSEEAEADVVGSGEGSGGAGAD